MSVDWKYPHVIGSRCAHEECDRPVYADGRFAKTDKCIFHAEEKDAQKFRNALAQLLNSWRRPHEWIGDFRGFIFVDGKKPPERYRGRDLSYWQVNNLFYGARFRGTATFNSAQFHGDAWFNAAQFHEDAGFFFAQFHGDAWFDAAQFQRYAGFNTAQFRGDAWFTSAQFQRYAGFNTAQFRGDAWFISAQFHGDCGFDAALFHGDAWFDSARFQGYARFVSPQFQGDAWFNSAQFQGDAWFDAAIFQSGLSLFHAEFWVMGSFTQTVIAGSVHFTWPGFGKKRNASSTTVERGIVLFRELEFGDRKYPNSGDIVPPLLDLRDNVLQDDSQLKIERCDMRYILLSGTDCTQIQFHLNTWPDLKMTVFKLPFRRQAAGDEYQLERLQGLEGFEKKDAKGKEQFFRGLEKTYQQLAKRHREEYSHPLANDFERGMFEMRRRAEAEKRSFAGWANGQLIRVYKYASLYSGSLLLPLCWLLLLTFLVFPVLYDASLYRFDPATSDTAVEQEAWLSTAIRCGILSLQMAVLNRNALTRELYENVWVYPGDRFWTSLLAAIQIVFTAALIALFLLSLRRRFKHGG